MHPFENFIKRYTNLTDAAWAKVEQTLITKDVLKGEHILKQGQTCRNMYFLEKGLLHFYTLNQAQENTKFFTVAPYFFTSQRSFAKQESAKESIQALEHSTLYSISRKDILMLREHTFWASFSDKLREEVQHYTEQIIEEIQQFTAEERYQKMLRDGDPLLERVPQKYLASYLGIAPQSLSRIRKQIMGRS